MPLVNTIETANDLDRMFIAYGYKEYVQKMPLAALEAIVDFYNEVSYDQNMEFYPADIQRAWNVYTKEEVAEMMNDYDSEESFEDDNYMIELDDNMYLIGDRTMM